MAQIGDKLTVIKVVPLTGRSIAPDLKMDEEKELKSVLKCSCGSEHYDVGLASDYNYITCFECGEELKDGDTIHWCHPSRFENQQK